MRTAWSERLLTALGDEVAGFQSALHRRAGGEVFPFEKEIEHFVVTGTIQVTAKVAVMKLEEALDAAVANYAALKRHRSTLDADKDTARRWTVQAAKIRSLIAEIEYDLAEEVRLLGPAVSAPDGTSHLLVETIDLGGRFASRVETLARLKKPARKGDKTNHLANMVARYCRAAWSEIAAEGRAAKDGGKDLRSIVRQIWVDYSLPAENDVDDMLKRAFRASA